MSLPLYWEAARDLPIGVQLAAAQNREDVLLRVASQVEAARPWADRRPPVSA
jgi:Asp-tRNA(Asn)/Glu-tRNA(Gln) amidotransferase A subunit family amidase